MVRDLCRSPAISAILSIDPSYHFQTLSIDPSYHQHNVKDASADQAAAAGQQPTSQGWLPAASPQCCVRLCQQQEKQDRDPAGAAEGTHHHQGVSHAAAWICVRVYMLGRGGQHEHTRWRDGSFRRQHAHLMWCCGIDPAAICSLLTSTTPQGPCCHDALSAKLIERAGGDTQRHSPCSISTSTSSTVGTGRYVSYGPHTAVCSHRLSSEHRKSSPTHTLFA